MSIDPERNSFVFLATPTSGTGSLWRIISALAGSRYHLDKVAERFANESRVAELRNWRPEASGFGYMYNTPHIECDALDDPKLRLIVNFRDPRDMACNQFHWVFQHPDHSRPADELEKRRAEVRALGIDKYVLGIDNSIHFRALKRIEKRLKAGGADVLILSYNQLCLDFDSTIEKLSKFFFLDPSAIPWDTINSERTGNLHANPNWIGQLWSGADTSPGRYLNELSAETVRTLDVQYRETLAFARTIEAPEFRSLLTTQTDRNEEKKVIQGLDGVLFLQNDSNQVIAQVEGIRPLTIDAMAQIAAVHRERFALCRDALAALYVHAVVPNKEVCLRAFLPSEVVFEGKGPRPIRQYLESMAAAVWRPFYDADVLKNDSPLKYFSRTDSHWNHAGAIRYLEKILSEFSPTLASALSKIQLRIYRGQQQGDLGIKLYMNPEEVDFAVPSRNAAKEAFHNKIVNEGSVRHYVNSSAPIDKRAIVLHDSFAMWLMGVLPELFKEVLFIHGTAFEYALLRQLRPDFVFCLQVERFFPRLPSNTASLLKLIEAEELAKGSPLGFTAYANSAGLLRAAGD